jgi:hypothetical protein
LVIEVVSFLQLSLTELLICFILPMPIALACFCWSILNEVCCIYDLLQQNWVLKTRKLVKTRVPQFLQVSARMYIQGAIIQLFMVNKSIGQQQFAGLRYI